MGNFGSLFFVYKQELVEYALKFSVENNIVNSKEWLNLKEENGLNNDSTHQNSTKYKLSTTNQISINFG
jgi:hypothetical protein